MAPGTPPGRQVTDLDVWMDGSMDGWMESQLLEMEERDHSVGG